ncbi:glutamine amidotransferase [uncultured Bartonella sp.]|uniref:glutamine amidotransferase n=1 Tax=uncultured Bartonella sp. TaxID=104108 RepID=UPI0026130958|nr:glutamine amidotransferase [uncultured Bartonella sp.]
MKKAVALRHLDFENAGLIEDVLTKRGYKIQNIDATLDDITAIDLDKTDIAIILGGPIGVYDDKQYPFIKAELKFIEQTLKRHKPMIGICLGAQMIATAMGAKVKSMGKKEIGFGELTLTKAGERSPLALIGDTPVLYWHGDQFDIPDGAECLAKTAICPNQAFSYQNVLALQFHLEAKLDYFEHWLVGHACELAQARIDPVVLRNNARLYKNALQNKAEQIFTTWFDLIENKQ